MTDTPKPTKLTETTRVEGTPTTATATPATKENERATPLAKVQPTATAAAPRGKAKLTTTSKAQPTRVSIAASLAAVGVAVAVGFVVGLGASLLGDANTLAAWGDFLVGSAAVVVVVAGVPSALWELRKRRLEHVEVKRAEVAGVCISASLAALSTLQHLIHPRSPPQFDTTARLWLFDDIDNDWDEQPPPEHEETDEDEDAREWAAFEKEMQKRDETDRARRAGETSQRWIEAAPVLEKVEEAIVLAHAYLPVASVRSMEDIRTFWVQMRARQAKWLSTSQPENSLRDGAAGPAAAQPIGELRKAMLGRLRQHTLMGGADDAER